MQASAFDTSFLMGNSTDTNGFRAASRQRSSRLNMKRLLAAKAEMTTKKQATPICCCISWLLKQTS